MIRGSCLCGKIRYQIDGTLGPAGHCHCSMCRKAHGAAFGTYSRVRWRDFRFTSGEDQVRRYASSPGIARSFCGSCGSTLQYLTESTSESFALALGTLDDDPGVRPVSHIFVGSKAPWFEITDTLPQYAGDG
ncbi:MAG TPA: GFA family protein [Steroidobacteraceae bacterium]